MPNDFRYDNAKIKCVYAYQETVKKLREYEILGISVHKPMTTLGEILMGINKGTLSHSEAIELFDSTYTAFAMEV